MLVSAVTPDGFTVEHEQGQDKLEMDKPAEMTDFHTYNVKKWLSLYQ